MNVYAQRTALVVMDYQRDILENFAREPEELVKRAARVIRGARRAKIPVVHVIVAFRPGYPEISARNKAFSGLAGAGLLCEGTAGAEIHPAVFPLPGEVVVTKRRVAAFGTTDLAAVLRAYGVETLVLMGVMTSGVVLSTVRWAADEDYCLVVLRDCCSDPDEEVHRILLDKVIAQQADVEASEEFLAKVAGTQSRADVGQ